MIRRRCFRPRFDRLDDRWLPAASVAGLTSAQLALAYGFNSVGANGAGQTIAIVDAFHDPNLSSDLATFDQANNLPGQTAAQVAGLLTQVNQAGGQTNDGWAGEEALDVEWAHAAAPGAKIVVVEAASASLNDLMAAVNTARNIPGVSVVSMSWGGSEFAGETSYDSYFTTPAGHTPITFVAASGDSGAYGGAEWPASSPNVVAVGGTTLQVDTSGNRLGERGWSGSGGGVSAYEPAPTYQAGVQFTGARTTPDVSLVADPRTGLATYVTTPSNGQGSWQVYGGTSASAQIWAGLLADANQARAAAGKATLDTATTLTTLYNAQGAFNDISSGFNGYPATTGYDLVTGLGTPKVAGVINALVQPGASTLPPTSGTPSGATTQASPPTSNPFPTSPSRPPDWDPTAPPDANPTTPSASVAMASPAASSTAQGATSAAATGSLVTIVAPGTATSTTSAPVLGNAAATSGQQAAPAHATVSALAIASPLPSTTNVVPQTLLGQPATFVGIPASELRDRSAPPRQRQEPEGEPATNPPPASDPTATTPSMPAEVAPPQAPAASEPDGQRNAGDGLPEDKAGLPDRVDAVIDGLFPGQPGRDASNPSGETVRPAMPAPPPDEPESDQAEESTSVPFVGAALVSLVVAWRSRLRSQSATPKGPLHGTIPLRPRGV
jgi:hypothetical protein